MSTLLLQNTAQILNQHGINAASRLCCALSGGLDSVVLFHLLTELQPHFGYHLQAAHIHHGLSANADHWQHFCEQLCKKYSTVLTITRVTLPKHPPEGIEAAARHARHKALASIPCDWLLFAHHQDDQAETLLFRLLRGTGIRGAGAIAPITQPRLNAAGHLRPLLTFRRSMLLSFAQAHKLSWVEDESNADCRYTRNNLRHRIIPALERTFPATVPTLARAANHFRSANQLLDELASIDNTHCLFNTLTVPFFTGTLFSRTALLSLNDARLANLFRWHLYTHGHQAPNQTHLDEMLRQLRHTPLNQPLYQPLGTLACCVYRDMVWFESHPAPTAPTIPLLWRGEPQLPWAQGYLTFTPMTGKGIDCTLLDSARTISLHTRRSGLRFKPEKNRPSRTFKNLCQEKGIPVWLRNRLPILSINDIPVWISGIGITHTGHCPDNQPGLVIHWYPSMTTSNTGTTK